MSSPFSQDWRDCLKAHYQHVCRMNDTLNERSLRLLLLNVGYTDDDLYQFKAEALVPQTPPDAEAPLEIIETVVLELEAAPEAPAPPVAEIAPEGEVPVEDTPAPPEPVLGDALEMEIQRRSEEDIPLQLSLF